MDILMSDFSKVASALSRRTHDTVKDKSTDLDIAQASHALKILKEIALDRPYLVLKALKIRPRAGDAPQAPERKRRIRDPRKPSGLSGPRRRPRRRPRKSKRLQQSAWRLGEFSTAYSRRMGHNNG